jgi:hypothetical protein
MCGSPTALARSHATQVTQGMREQRFLTPFPIRLSFILAEGLLGLEELIEAAKKVE